MQLLLKHSPCAGGLSLEGAPGSAESVTRGGFGEAIGQGLWGPFLRSSACSTRSRLQLHLLFAAQQPQDGKLSGLQNCLCCPGGSLRSSLFIAAPRAKAELPLAWQGC